MTHHLHRPEGRIAYSLDGPADGRLVVLVPGLGDLRSTWRDVTAPLVAAGYRVAALDLRGHGDSDPFTEHGVAEYADDVVDLVETLAAGQPAVLVGNSVGAGAVARVAADRPDLVAAVALLAYAANDAATSRAVALQIRLLLQRPWGPRAWAAFYSSLLKGRRAPWTQEHLAAIRADLRRPGHLEQVRTLALALVAGGHDPRLADVTAPVLVVTGAQDPESKDPADALAAAVRGATSSTEVRSVLVDECGHYPQHQRPDVVVPALLDLLATHAPTPARA